VAGHSDRASREPTEPPFYAALQASIAQEIQRLRDQGAGQSAPSPAAPQQPGSDWGDAPAWGQPAAPAVRGAPGWGVGPASPSYPPPLRQSRQPPSLPDQEESPLSPQERAERDAKDAKARLDTRLRTLQELQFQLMVDPELFRFVAGVLTNEVHAAEQRQQARFQVSERQHTQALRAALQAQQARFEEAQRRQMADSLATEGRQQKQAIRLTVVSSVISLLVGWVLSAVNFGSAIAHLVTR
jgi:hypothetical protein